MTVGLRGALVLSLIAAVGAPARAQSDAAVASISKDTRKALDDTFDKWELASIEPQSAACRTGGGEAPRLVRGDLNSDGQPDLALAIKARDGVHLVVVFERVTEHIVVDIERLGDSSANGYLMVEPRGSAYVNPADGLHDYFVSDTLAVYRCGQPATAYFWSGLGFRKVSLIGDVTAPSH
jgi:hypothetical protein